MSAGDVLASALAGAIRAERKAQERTQAAVFEAAGISKRAYITYENGTRDLSVPRLIAIAAALNVTPADLFRRAQDAASGRTPPMTAPNPDERYQIVVTHRAVHDAIIRALGPNAVLAPMPSAEDDLPTYGVVPRVVVEASSFTCPSCGRTSYHPEDVANGYCGACHAFTGTPGARA